MRKIDELTPIAARYFSAANAHRAEYAQMREGAWAQIPGFEKTNSPAERKAEAKLRRAELATAELTIDAKRKPGGTSIKTPVKLQTSVGKERANFKHDTEAFTRHDAQSRIQQRVDVPTPPSVHRHLEKEGEIYDGWLKSNIPDDDTLNVDSTKWTREQVREVLVGAVMSELLGNYDTKSDQWSVKGGHAIMGDLDHATEDLGQLDSRELTRHTVGSYAKGPIPAIPPAVNLAYADFVHGRLELDDADFGAMFDVIARLQAIPDAEFKAMFADAVPNPLEREKMVVRRDTLHLEFADLIEDLKSEKTARENGTLGVFTGAKLFIQDKKQLALAHYSDSKWMERINRLTQRVRAVIAPPKPIALAN